MSGPSTTVVLHRGPSSSNGGAANDTTAAPLGAPGADRAGATLRMPIGRWLRTTPGLLVLCVIAIVVALVAAGATGTAALVQRRDAVESAGTTSGSKLVTAGELYASLAAADATAASALLRSGSEPETVRERYQSELENAERALVDIGGNDDASSVTRDPTEIIATQLTTYIGRVEAARTNRRLENPVGAAYMRAASAQMRSEILPAATEIWRDAAVQLDGDLEAGTSTRWPVAFAWTGGLALVALLALAAFLAMRTRRILNLGVVAALVLVVAGGTLSFVVMANQHEALVRARQEGSDPLQTLSTAYFLGLQGQADVNLGLAERDTREAYLDEFDVFSTRIVGPDGRSGLLGDAHPMAMRTGDGAKVLSARTAFHAYREVEAEVRAKDANGDHESAVTQSLSDGADGLAGASAALNDRMEVAIGTSEQRFTAATTDARTGARVMVVGLAVALLAAIACLIAGVLPRIGEYR